MALMDTEGHAITSRFVAVRSKSKELPLQAIWAVLNSPLANAYIYTRGTKRDILKKLVQAIPIPNWTFSDILRLSDLVASYFSLFSSQIGSLSDQGFSQKAMERLLAVDAEVLRLYDLPPRVERQLLDLFRGYKRKGVPFDFSRYFAEDFESCIPLHEYLSEEYQRSTVSFVSQWVKKTRSPEMIEALDTATKAFSED
jgi:hypothetical protein